uniref:Putative salivary scp/antigen 5 protein n=1 Tax=Panstrongylus megistus TaxID=65343 RepID=A0A069DXV1_9HEMI
MAKTHCHLVFSLLALALVRSLPTTATKLECNNTNKLLGVLELTEEDRQYLLEVHNTFRKFAASGKALGGQPPAQNMLELTWDEHAAQQAYDWASLCQWKHNQPTDIDGKSPMGQNLALKSSTKLSKVRKTFDKWMKSMVRGWYNEVKLYTFGSPFSMETGHYTQLVWATTSKLGCGYSYYQEIDDSNTKWHSGYLVCNYNPAGNWEGKVPYVTGKQNCSGYDLDKSTKYPHLCVEKKKKKGN